MTDKPHPVKTKKIAITIGRQFGSGGRELGKKIAERLQIPYYDKELLSKVSEHTGVDKEIVKRNDERSPKFLSNVMSFSMGFAPVNWYQNPSSISSDSIYAKQSDIIRAIANESSCVIVGRSSDYVLRDHPHTVNIFVHAPVENCIDRIVRRGDSMQREKARRLAEKTNRLRASYYNFFTDKEWGHASGYDLTFDTSLLSTDDIADIVVEYIRRRFE